MKPMRGVIVAGAVGLAAPASAQNFDSVKVQVVPVSSGIAMLVGAGGNIAVSYGDDAVFLVDDQFAPLSPKILAAVASLSAKPVRFVLNTHWHGDHTGGNEPMGEAGALIVAHDNVRKRMSTEQFNEFFRRATPASPAGALPVVTFTDAVTFHLNGDEIHAFHIPPAHTDGDAIIVFRRANVVHMGDTFFTARYPFIDLDSGGSVAGAIEAANRVLALCDAQTKIIPGHGALATRTDLERYRDMLMTARDRVAGLVRDGKTVDQIVAAKPLADLDGVWGTGFINPENFLRILYRDLSRK
jgi:glyoxylase-like metal-dependent hydrolase (beta-lactamase superfamily II)